MDNMTFIWAIVFIAAIAVVGRIIINRQQKGSINWFKLLLVGVALLAIVLGYIYTEPQRIFDAVRGEATVAESLTHNVAGRVAGKDIPCFSVAYNDYGTYFCAPVADSLSRTDYYVIKDINLSDLMQREVEEYTNGKISIKHKTNLFEVTKDPHDKADMYLPLYRLYLKSGGSILAVIDERDARNAHDLPVARLNYPTAKISSIAERLDTAMIRDTYLMCFNSDEFTDNQTRYPIYRAIAGILYAIMSVLVLMAIKHFSKR